jgi:hypothetical protein
MSGMRNPLALSAFAGTSQVAVYYHSTVRCRDSDILPPVLLRLYSAKATISHGPQPTKINGREDYTVRNLRTKQKKCPVRPPT